MTGKGMREMMSSDDITDIEGNGWKILEACGEPPTPAARSGRQVQVQGRAADDVYVQSYVFKKEHGAAETAEWRCVYGHRSTGRAPTEDARGRGRAGPQKK